MLKIVERDWLLNLRGTGYVFTKLMITKERSEIMTASVYF